MPFGRNESRDGGEQPQGCVYPRAVAGVPRVLSRLFRTPPTPGRQVNSVSFIFRRAQRALLEPRFSAGLLASPRVSPEAPGLGSSTPRRRRAAQGRVGSGVVGGAELPRRAGSASLARSSSWLRFGRGALALELDTTLFGHCKKPRPAQEGRAWVAMGTRRPGAAADNLALHSGVAGASARSSAGIAVFSAYDEPTPTGRARGRPCSIDERPRGPEATTGPRRRSRRARMFPSSVLGAAPPHHLHAISYRRFIPAKQ